MTIDTDQLSNEEAAATEKPDLFSEIERLFPDAPKKDVIEGWKSRFGKVNAYAPNDDDLFIFRALRRMEHRNIAKDMQVLSESAAAKADEGLVEQTLFESVVKVAVLYPQITPEFLSSSPAGLIPVLYNLIMRLSHFVDMDKAIVSTFKL